MRHDVAGFVVLYSLVSWIEWFLVCKPLEGFWDKSVKAECIAQNVHKGFALFNTGMYSPPGASPGIQQYS